ncbi:class Ib ribonucleoside-diphosphate reductase assembly flavoprotein NrdI [Nocardia farcinica]|uniref:class Ib ribonucleoside-diphosphate reductase assembly flavoprotein NrdI n=1 Tax=Nocardia farcinica TaxID=37329 RepID=UPI001892FD9A|nr:class Ib ribonucleoside-diphosphate reductase assembly flavoprotein NrdI [Nocardia farcinica]MBF6230361.1 class Ib ribonucleoside-diphosphate reductase assembly flavoprotein NrdI [Nocardia farcinica]
MAVSPEGVASRGTEAFDDTALVYFSSASENTHRFVEKLGLPATRIPLHTADSLRVGEPYVLIVPTYGGGRHVLGGARSDKEFVPRQVAKFLNDPHNRSLLRGVIAAGNTNFGDTYCYAGEVISRKCGVPYLYRFELMGTAQDVERVREGLGLFWQQQRQRRPESRPA